jgi:hypothetical protein
MNPLHRCLVTLGAGLAFTSTASAQSSEWERTLLFYLLGAGLDGTTQIGPLETDIDQSFSDILENLDAGFMGAFRASNGTWAHTIDTMYVGLEAEVTRASGASLKAEVDQLMAAYDIGYRVSESFEVLAGARYNSIELDLTVRGPFEVRNASGDKDWIDPYVGFNSTIPFNDKLALVLRADVGGFDIGSKLAWQAIVRLDWQFGDTFFGTVGYRILDVDYEDGSGASFFKYDVTTSGPGIGVGWRFR